MFVNIHLVKKKVKDRDRHRCTKHTVITTGVKWIENKMPPPQKKTTTTKQQQQQQQQQQQKKAFKK